MEIAQRLSVLALRTMVDGAGRAAGVYGTGIAIDSFVNLLTQRFTDHAERLPKALALAQQQAWKAIEIALAGDSMWDRCKILLATGEQKGFREQVKKLLDETSFTSFAKQLSFRPDCLRELHSARKQGVLDPRNFVAKNLADGIGSFAKHHEPQSIIEAEYQTVTDICTELKSAGFGNLATLIALRPATGLPLLVIAVKYFFRRAVEEDTKLFQGLTFDQMEKLAESQDKAFDNLHLLITKEGDRLTFLVMDYFAGSTLEDRVRERGALTVEQLMPVALPMAEGMSAAHQRGILHRDVKPANLLVREEPAGWQVRLIDFGLALRSESLRSTMATSHTLAGATIAGTLDYAAPEQMGRSSEPIRATADIYGFGKTCCFALFSTPTPLLRHWRMIPPNLAELLEACMEESPRNRPQSMNDVVTRLREVQNGVTSPRPFPAPVPPVIQPTPVTMLAPLAANVIEASDLLTVEGRGRALSVLTTQVATCTKCPDLVKSRTNTVFGAGRADSIGKLRGKFFDYRGVSILCTYHPAYLLPGRAPEKKKEVWEDLKLLLRRMGREVPATPHQFLSS